MKFLPSVGPWPTWYTMPTKVGLGAMNYFPRPPTKFAKGSLLALGLGELRYPTPFSNPNSKDLGMNGLESGRCWSGLVKLFLELGRRIGHGKFLTHNLPCQFLRNFAMMLPGYILRFGMNFIQFHPHIPVLLDFTSGIMKLRFHLSFMYSPNHRP